MVTANGEQVHKVYNLAWIQWFGDIVAKTVRGKNVETGKTRNQKKGAGEDDFQPYKSH